MFPVVILQTGQGFKNSEPYLAVPAVSVVVSTGPAPNCAAIQYRISNIDARSCLTAEDDLPFSFTLLVV